MSTKYDSLINVFTTYPLLTIKFRDDIEAVRGNTLTEEVFEKRWKTTYVKASEMYDRTITLLKTAVTIKGAQLTELVGWYRDLARKQDG